MNTPRKSSMEPEELRLLERLSLDVIEAESTTAAFEVVLRWLCEENGWSVAQAWAPRADGTQLELIAALPAPGRFEAASRGVRLTRGVGLPGRVWATGHSAWFQDLPAHPDFIRGKEALAAGLRTGGAVPILARGEVVAAVEFFSTEPREECPRLLQLLTAISAQLGSWLRRQRAEEALRTTEEQLRHAQKMEAVGRLAGGVAHDFNNLLTVILGYTELLATQLDAASPLQRHVEQVTRAGERAASLTRQLLVFSRHEQVVPQLLEPNAVIGDLERLLRRLIGEDIELRTTLQAHVGQVLVDQGYLEQVVVNLCVNARDAMPHGGRLTIETDQVELDPTTPMTRSAVPAPGRYVMIAVNDSGCGMDKEVQSHLFEPFFTTKEVGKGTGLGLSTVYGIVAGAHGHVGVYSEVGVGTSIKVYLPRAGAGAAPGMAPVVVGAAPRGSETILLIEDDEMVRGLARSALEERGYSVLEARSGGEALLLCEQRQNLPIDLVLTDVVMPGLSGPEVVKRLESIRPGLRILFCSGYTSGALQREEALCTGRAFMQKPFTPAVLASMVRKVLDGPN